MKIVTLDFTIIEEPLECVVGERGDIAVCMFDLPQWQPFNRSIIPTRGIPIVISRQVEHAEDLILEYESYNPFSTPRNEFLVLTVREVLLFQLSDDSGESNVVQREVLFDETNSPERGVKLLLQATSGRRLVGPGSDLIAYSLPPRYQDPPHARYRFPTSYNLPLDVGSRSLADQDTALNHAAQSGHVTLQPKSLALLINQHRLGCELDLGTTFTWTHDQKLVVRYEGNFFAQQETSAAQIWFPEGFSGVAYTTRELGADWEAGLCDDDDSSVDWSGSEDGKDCIPISPGTAHDTKQEIEETPQKGLKRKRECENCRSIPVYHGCPVVPDSLVLVWEFSARSWFEKYQMTVNYSVNRQDVPCFPSTDEAYRYFQEAEFWYEKYLYQTKLGSPTTPLATPKLFDTEFTRRMYEIINCLGNVAIDDILPNMEAPVGNDESKGKAFDNETKSDTSQDTVKPEWASLMENKEKGSSSNTSEETVKMETEDETVVQESEPVRPMDAANRRKLFHYLVTETNTGRKDRDPNGGYEGDTELNMEEGNGYITDNSDEFDDEDPYGAKMDEKLRRGL